MSGRARLVRHQYFPEKPRFELPVDSYGPHWSAFAVEEGLFRYEIGDSRGTAGPGSLVVCPPETDFYRQSAAPVSFHFLIFDWKCGEGEAQGDQLPPGRLPIRNTERLISTMSLLRQYTGDISPFRQEYGSHLLTDMLYLYVAEQSPAYGLELFPTEDTLITEACAYMRQTYAEGWTLQQLSERYGLSAVQFSRRFKRAYGSNPSEFITRLRLEQAVGLLGNPSLTIDEIARQCGYSNGFYLCRVFQTKYGMSPSAYRRAHRV